MSLKPERKPLKQAVRDWLRVLVLFLDDAAALAAIIIALRLLGVQVPLYAAIVLLVAFVGLVLVIHQAIIPSLHRRPAAGLESMVGLEGRAVKPLTPRGTISVKGEYWSAESQDGTPIAGGERVDIVGAAGMTLQVRRRPRGGSPTAPR